MRWPVSDKQLVNVQKRETMGRTSKSNFLRADARAAGFALTWTPSSDGVALFSKSFFVMESASLDIVASRL